MSNSPPSGLNCLFPQLCCSATVPKLTRFLFPGGICFALLFPPSLEFPSLKPCLTILHPIWSLPWFFTFPSAWWDFSFLCYKFITFILPSCHMEHCSYLYPWGGSTGLRVRNLGAYPATAPHFFGTLNKSCNLAVLQFPYLKKVTSSSLGGVRVKWHSTWKRTLSTEMQSLFPYFIIFPTYLWAIWGERSCLVHHYIVTLLSWL